MVNITNKKDNVTMLTKDVVDKILNGQEAFINEEDNKMVTKQEIRAVYIMLKDRELHPSGSFDKAGRFYAEHDDLISVREPSRAYPYSHMTACRTLKYVNAVAEKFKPNTVDELIKLV